MSPHGKQRGLPYEVSTLSSGKAGGACIPCPEDGRVEARAETAKQLSRNLKILERECDPQNLGPLKTLHLLRVPRPRIGDGCTDNGLMSENGVAGMALPTFRIPSRGTPCGPCAVPAASQPGPVLDQTVPWTGFCAVLSRCYPGGFGEPSPRHGKTAHPDSCYVEEWPGRSRHSTALPVQLGSPQRVRPSDPPTNQRELRIRSPIEIMAASIPRPLEAGTGRPNTVDATRP